MGKLNIFQISFANMTGIYHSGEFVDGHVTVELTAAMNMRGIQLECGGKAYVYWSVTSGSGKDKKTKRYTATEEYFNHSLLLFGKFSDEGPDRLELPMGRHTFPFRFQLPSGLPSSFEQSNGHVRYSLSCKIDKAEKYKSNHTTERLFTVISSLDLNGKPAYLEPVVGNNQKHLCCLCCKSGPITAQFSIERKGWVPGEAIKVYADISNDTSRMMDKSYVQLQMIANFYAECETERDSRQTVTEVARVTRPCIPGFCDDSWTGEEELVIPPVPPSFLVGCKIIDVQYVLQLNVAPAGLALDLEVPLSIIIGTIPLMSVTQQAPPTAPPMPPPDMYGMAAEGGGYGKPPPPIAGIPNIPPPSYSECITGKVAVMDIEDSEYTKGDRSFSPAYTYYDWGHKSGAMPKSITKG